MHSPLKYLSFAVATLILTLISGRSISGATVNNVAYRSLAPSEQTNTRLPVQESGAEVERLFREGVEHLDREQRLEARQSFEQALEIERKLGEPEIEDDASWIQTIEELRSLVAIYTPLKDANETVEFSKTTLALAREQRDRDKELEALITLGDAYISLGEYDQAVESARASVTLAQELQNFQAKASAFITLASAYESLASSKSEYRKATKAAISGLTTAWKIKDHISEIKALAILSSVYSSMSEDQNAIIFAKQALKVAKVNNISNPLAPQLLTLAGVYLKEQNYQNVIASTEKGIISLQNLQQPETEGAASVMQSLAYFATANYQQSLELAERGLAIAQDVESPLVEALALIVLSFNYSEARDSEKALELINESRSIAKEEDNPELEALTLEVRAEIYRNAQQKEQAIASYQEALSITDSFSALAGIARLYQESNLLATAITYYKQAVNKNEEQIRRVIPGLPSWLEESFGQGVQNIHGLQSTEVYRSLTSLLLLENRRLEAQQVLELLKGQELREYTGDPEVNLTESGEPASLTITPAEEQIIREYGSLISFGYQLNECQQTRCPQLEELLEQRKSLTEQYYQGIGRLETAIHNKQETDEAFVDPNQFALKAQRIVEAEPGTVLIYPLVLEDKLWLLWASKGGIFKSVEVPGVTQAELEVTALRFRQLLQNRLSNLEEVQATGKQLYDWLVKPLEQELQANDIKNLVFSLDRSARYIPMATLFDGEKYLIETYSVSTVVSANLTNTQLPTQEQKVAGLPFNFQRVNASAGERIPVIPDKQEMRLLAMGVSEAVGGFQALPSVLDELDVIVRRDSLDPKGIYPGQEFLNQDFNFFTLRDNLFNHELLHIATHSEFVPGRANQSYLLLGTGEKLAIPDIKTWLDLRNINTVVLSACETALGGPGLDGREIAGIGYYFLKSGASNVIASLWNVDDQSTRILMEQFYENLSKGTPDSPLTKAQALRQAQLLLLNGGNPTEVGLSRLGQAPRVNVPLRSQSAEQEEENLPPTSNTSNRNPFRHPYYWSPFILMGSGM